MAGRIRRGSTGAFGGGRRPAGGSADVSAARRGAMRCDQRRRYGPAARVSVRYLHRMRAPPGSSSWYVPSGVLPAGARNQPGRRLRPWDAATGCCCLRVLEGRSGRLVGLRRLAPTAPARLRGQSSGHSFTEEATVGASRIDLRRLGAQHRHNCSVELCTMLFLIEVRPAGTDASHQRTRSSASNEVRSPRGRSAPHRLRAQDPRHPRRAFLSRGP